MNFNLVFKKKFNSSKTTIQSITSNQFIKESNETNSFISLEKISLSCVLGTSITLIIFILGVLAIFLVVILIKCILKRTKRVRRKIWFKDVYLIFPEWFLSLIKVFKLSLKNYPNIRVQYFCLFFLTNFFSSFGREKT